MQWCQVTATSGRRSNGKLEKFQGLKEELERMWKVKATRVPVMVGVLAAVTPKLESGSNRSLEQH